jgi:urea transport system permease protein
MVVFCPPARAGALEDAVQGLAASSEGAIDKSVAQLAALDDPRAVPALEALTDDRLRAGPGGRAYIWNNRNRELIDPITEQPLKPQPTGEIKEVEVSNEIRRMLAPVLAQLQLGSPRTAVRQAAAEELAKGGSPEASILLHKAVLREKDKNVHEAMMLALARVDLQNPDANTKLAAIDVIHRTGNDVFLADLQRLAAANSDGTFAEPDPRVRLAAKRAVDAVLGRQRLISMAGSLVHGISLASVLLFAALGLAITFGVMGVINMAHGEMLMLGAYATYSVQVLFQKYLPGYFQWYLLLAIPVAFAVCVAVGILLETVIVRRLYGRPLETLLATWGISLGLIQTVRLIFGAQNVAVANPDWLAGGKEILHGLVLPYNRMAVVLFVIIVAMLVWVVLQRTRLGLQVRAVTQNRAMAACMGISTSRVDMWTFGLGSGIAGLGGVALSQLGNVGPELGQSYILDSFMVVVVGGVGRIAGTIAAASGLGIINKLLEPFAGAVMGKIVVLAFIILFIQRRPQGLFSVKGRVEA